MIAGDSLVVRSRPIPIPKNSESHANRSQTSVSCRFSGLLMLPDLRCSRSMVRETTPMGHSSMIHSYGIAARTEEGQCPPITVLARDFAGVNAALLARSASVVRFGQVPQDAM